MDYYRTVLDAIYDLLILAEDKCWADWIAMDIRLWESQNNVQHHLSAFHKDGINDLWICVGNKHKVTYEQEPWACRLLSELTFWSCYFAKRIAKNKAQVIKKTDKYSSRLIINGMRCFSCGYPLITSKSIDFLISIKIVQNEVQNALRQNKLKETMAEILSLNLPIIKIEKERLKKTIENSDINYSENHAFMRPCCECGSNDTGSYRWIQKRQILVPTKDNLRLRLKAK